MCPMMGRRIVQRAMGCVRCRSVIWESIQMPIRVGVIVAAVGTLFRFRHFLNHQRGTCDMLVNGFCPRKSPAGFPSFGAGGQLQQAMFIAQMPRGSVSANPSRLLAATQAVLHKSILETAISRFVSRFRTGKAGIHS